MNAQDRRIPAEIKRTDLHLRAEEGMQLHFNRVLPAGQANREGGYVKPLNLPSIAPRLSPVSPEPQLSPARTTQGRTPQYG
jgi:hypothetical protein